MTDFEKLVDAAKSGNVEQVRALLKHRLELVNQRDPSGATPLHYAALGGHREVVRLLAVHGADINARDAQFGATPAGWAIEYLRELGGFLGIEISDFAYAVHRQDVDWVARFLTRFPALRLASDENGVPFKLLAAQTANPDLVRLFQVQTGVGNE